MTSKIKLQRVVRCLLLAALVWGIIGGWEILGHWWPQLNRLTKDQVTIIVALVLLLKNPNGKEKYD